MCVNKADHFEVSLAWFNWIDVIQNISIISIALQFYIKLHTIINVQDSILSDLEGIQKTFFFTFEDSAKALAPI